MVKKLKYIFIVLFLVFGVFNLKAEQLPDTRFTEEGVPFQRDWRFNAGTPQYCFGKTDGISVDGCNTGYMDAQRFQVISSGTSVNVQIYTGSTAGANPKVRLAVYDDTTWGLGTQCGYGCPQNKLWEGDSLTWLPNTWLISTVTSINLIAGKYYWLVFKVNVNATRILYGATAPLQNHWWKSGQAWTSPFLNPFGLSSGRNSNQHNLQLCYEIGGEEVYSGRFPRGILRGVMR